MKKGVAGVRLCDQSGCYERWPCARHGTLTYSSWSLHWSGGAHVQRLVPTDFDEPAACSCGYVLCSCPVPGSHRPAEAPAESIYRKWCGQALSSRLKSYMDEFFAQCAEPRAPHGVIPLDGWRHLGGLDWYINESLPAGFCTVASDSYGWACKASADYWQHPVEAMIDAEDLARAAAEPKPAEPKPEKLRPGWYYLPDANGMKESYEHESLPWEYGKVYFRQSEQGWGCETDHRTYLSPYRAMFEAEKAYERDQEEIDHG